MDCNMTDKYRDPDKRLSYLKKAKRFYITDNERRTLNNFRLCYIIASIRNLKLYKNMANKLRYDEIGYWSEIKLDIIREYAAVYSKILTTQQRPSFHHIYIDAFAGAGQHISKDSGEFIPGSPLNALQIEHPFKEYHFIDLDEQKVEFLESLSGSRHDVNIHHGDCNSVLLEKVLPKVRYEEYKRALCVLDS